MRSRSGGIIGTRVQPNPYISSASGMWTLGEAFQWSKESVWPTGLLLVGGVPSLIDATVSSAAIISPSISSSYPSVVYRWEKSQDAGGTWSTISGQVTETLTLSGLTAADDGDLCRLVATAGIRSRKSSNVEIRRDTVASVLWDNAYGPANTSVSNGSYAYFYAIASATGVTHGTSYWTFGYGETELRPYWQRSTNGGSSWSDVPEFEGWSIGFEATTAMNGHRYRAKVTIAGSTYYSPVGILTVT